MQKYQLDIEDVEAAGEAVGAVEAGEAVGAVEAAEVVETLEEGALSIDLSTKSERESEGLPPVMVSRTWLQMTS